jgi:transposase-like protein
MMPTRATRSDSAEKTVRDIRRATRRQYSAEEKIRIVLEGLRGETSIAELCRKEGIAQSMYYGWSKEFLEAGKRRLVGDTAREAVQISINPTNADDNRLHEPRNVAPPRRGDVLGRGCQADAGSQLRWQLAVKSHYG